jgi:hypothetical protein
MSVTARHWPSIGRTACALLIGIYLVIGIVRVGPAIIGGETPTPQRWSSTDKYLLNTAGLENGSREILHALSRVPASKPVAVFALQSSASSTLTAYIISYLAWPRPVRMVTIAGKEKPEPIEQHSFGALFFCGMAPPPDQIAGERLGSNLTFVLIPDQSLHAQP